MSEKYLKLIAEELQLIRKELQYHNDMKFEPAEEDEDVEVEIDSIPIADQLNKMFKKDR